MGKLGKSFRANLLYLSLSGDGSYKSCIPALTDALYHVVDLRNGINPELRYDVIIVDARGLKLATTEDLTRVDEIKHQHPESSLMILTDLSAPYTLRQKVKSFGTVWAVGNNPELILPRLEKLLENLALADECGERLKTLSVLNSAAASANDLRPPSTDIRVLVSGAPSPLSLRTLSSLKNAGFDVSAAISIPQTLSYLEAEMFDALVIAPGNKSSVYTSLIKLLRRNEKTRSLPVLVLSDDEIALAEKAGVRYLTQGADLFLTGRNEEQAILTEVKSFAKRNRLTKSMRRFLRKSVMPGAKPNSIACDLEFFETHLARQCASSMKSNRHLCLSVFRLKTVQGSEPSVNVCRQAVSYAEMMMQDTDLMTVIRNDLILISQPGRVLVDANNARRRIVALLQELKFKSGLSPAACEDLIVISSTVCFAQDEHPEEMITRALQSMTEIPRPAARKQRASLTLVK